MNFSGLEKVVIGKTLSPVLDSSDSTSRMGSLATEDARSEIPVQMICTACEAQLSAPRLSTATRQDQSQPGSPLDTNACDENGLDSDGNYLGIPTECVCWMYFSDTIFPTHLLPRPGSTFLFGDLLVSTTALRYDCVRRIDAAKGVLSPDGLRCRIPNPPSVFEVLWEGTYPVQTAVQQIIDSNVEEMRKMGLHQAKMYPETARVEEEQDAESPLGTTNVWLTEPMTRQTKALVTILGLPKVDVSESMLSMNSDLSLGKSAYCDRTVGPSCATGHAATESSHLE